MTAKRERLRAAVRSEISPTGRLAFAALGLSCALFSERVRSTPSEAQTAVTVGLTWVFTGVVAVLALWAATGLGQRRCLGIEWSAWAGMASIIILAGAFSARAIGWATTSPRGVWGSASVWSIHLIVVSTCLVAWSTARRLIQTVGANGGGGDPDP